VEEDPRADHTNNGINQVKRDVKRRVREQRKVDEMHLWADTDSWRLLCKG
jgi:hypothetical protein